MPRDSAHSPEPADRRPQAATLVKGLDLLEAIIADGGRSNLSTIATRAGMAIATAHRLAVALEGKGYLVRGQKGIYHPGQGLAKLAPLGNVTLEIAARLRRPLAGLARTHGAYTHFGTLEDNMVTYLVKERGNAAELFTEEKMQLEAYCSAIGKVLLAAMSPKNLEAYLASGPFVAITRQTITDPADLRREIDEVRASGVAYDRHEIRDDLFCIAVPVRYRGSATIGAVSLSLLDRVPDRALLRRMTISLRRLSDRAATDFARCV